MQKTFITLLLSLIAIPMLAQKITVTGTVIDGDTKEGIPSATVRILSLPDSSMVAGAATSTNGSFSIKSVKKGKYAIKVTYIGYHDHVIPLDISKAKSPYDAGYITMYENTRLLKEAVVSANAAQVQVSGDSLVYNASAFRTAEGSALEDLVKKLPGAEIDDDGNVTINGKTVSKILVDGKEFFLNDKNIALKNIPTSAIDKIKAYDRKSDLARVTGIDDGNEETVLDLQFKKGMNNGWFGNLDASIGTKKRYSEKLMINRFIDHNQFSLIGSTNNIGDRGFGGGGGRGGWGRGGNGLMANKNVGFNFATESDKLETGGNVRYRYDGTDVKNSSNTESFYSNTYDASRSVSYTSANALNADFRLEWKPDSMTNIIFRPSGTYTRNRGYSASASAELNENPYNYISNPILDDYSINSEIHKIDSLIVNTDASRSQTYSNNRSVSAEFQYNRKLNTRGRNITFRATGGLSGSDSKSLTAQDLEYIKIGSATINNRHVTTPARNSNYSLQATYSEPIADRTYLQFSYRFDYSYSSNDRQTFTYDQAAYDKLYESLLANRYDINAVLDYMKTKSEKYAAYDELFSDSLSKFTQYRNYNHTIGLTFRKVTDNYNLSAGIEILPQHSSMKYKMNDYSIDTTRTVINFTPAIDFRYNFDKQTQFRINYRGRTSAPSMTDLLPVTDNTNTKNIRVGNPGLRSSLNHNIRANFNTYNADLQQGIFTFGGLTFTQNAISSRTSYDTETGVRTTKSENINGNWNGDLGLGYNRGLGANKYFTVNNFARVGYRHQVSYLDPTQYTEEKSKTNQTDLNDRLSFGYRRDWFEASINGSVTYSHSRNNVVTTGNLDTWQFSYGTEFNFNFDFGLSINTDLSESSRRGYSNSSMNTNELLWNAQASYSFLKGRALTVTAQWNDILGQRSNISRSISALQSSDSEYNAIYSYGMIHVIYKLNIFGGKNANGTAEERVMTPWGMQRAGDNSNSNSKDSKNNRRGGFGGGRPGGPGPR